MLQAMMPDAMIYHHYDDFIYQKQLSCLLIFAFKITIKKSYRPQSANH